MGRVRVFLVITHGIFKANGKTICLIGKIWSLTSKTPKIIAEQPLSFSRSSSIWGL
jgi:hypothetical protein